MCLSALASRSLSAHSFVGAIVDNFRKIRAERTGSALLTTEQIQWVKVMKECRIMKAPKPPLPPTILVNLRMPFYQMVLSAPFQNAMLLGTRTRKGSPTPD